MKRETRALVAQPRSHFSEPSSVMANDDASRILEALDVVCEASSEDLGLHPEEVHRLLDKLTWVTKADPVKRLIDSLQEHLEDIEASLDSDPHTAVKQKDFRQILERRSLANDYDEWEAITYGCSKAEFVSQNLSQVSDKQQWHAGLYSKEKGGVSQNTIRRGMKLLVIERLYGSSGISPFFAHVAKRLDDITYDRLPELVQSLQELQAIERLVGRAHDWFEDCNQAYCGKFAFHKYQKRFSYSVEEKLSQGLSSSSSVVESPAFRKRKTRATHEQNKKPFSPSRNGAPRQPSTNEGVASIDATLARSTYPGQEPPRQAPAEKMGGPVEQLRVLEPRDLTPQEEHDQQNSWNTSSAPAASRIVQSDHRFELGPLLSNTSSDGMYLTIPSSSGEQQQSITDLVRLEEASSFGCFPQAIEYYNSPRPRLNALCWPQAVEPPNFREYNPNAPSWPQAVEPPNFREYNPNAPSWPQAVEEYNSLAYNLSNPPWPRAGDQ